MVVKEKMKENTRFALCFSDSKMIKNASSLVSFFIVQYSYETNFI